MDAQLSDREWEVLCRVSEGQTGKDIAQAMYLSKSEINKMLSGSDKYRSIYLKIGARNRAEAVAWYVEQTRLKVAEQEADEAHERHLDTLFGSNLAGNPRFAIRELDHLIPTLRERARTSRYPKQRLELLAKALSIKGRLLSSLSKPLEFYAERKTSNEAVPFAQELSDIGQELNDYEILGMADYFRADAYYIARRWSASVNHLRLALTEVKQPLYIVQNMHRTLASNYSLHPQRENYQTEFYHEVAEVAQLDDTAIPDEWGIIAAECVARALARFGDTDEAFKWIQRSQARLDRMQKEQPDSSLLRTINLGRGELFVKRLSKTGHPDDWAAKAHELIQLGQGQYPRLEAELKGYLHFSE